MNEEIHDTTAAGMFDLRNVLKVIDKNFGRDGHIQCREDGFLAAKRSLEHVKRATPLVGSSGLQGVILLERLRIHRPRYRTLYLEDGYSHRCP
jgi:hypothetical protein